MAQTKVQTPWAQYRLRARRPQGRGQSRNERGSNCQSDLSTRRQADRSWRGQLRITTGGAKDRANGARSHPLSRGVAHCGHDPPLMRGQRGRKYDVRRGRSADRDQHRQRRGQMADRCKTCWPRSSIGLIFGYAGVSGGQMVDLCRPRWPRSAIS